MGWFKKYPTMLEDIDKNVGNIQIHTKIFWGEHEAILHKEDISNTMLYADEYIKGLSLYLD